MPFPRQWLPRLPEILAEVRHFPAPEIDREAIMGLFGLKRRAALLLMREIGPRAIRGRWFVDRQELLRWLAARQPEADQESGRRARWSRTMLQADLEKPRRPSPLLTVRLSPEEVRETVDFPAGVSLTPGRPSVLTIEFASITDLAEKILRLGVAMNRNLDRYVALVEPQSGPSAEEQEQIRRERDYFLHWKPGDP